MAEERLASPRQVAVALRYESGEDAAPRVVAKGHDAVAGEILRIAREHGVAVHQDRDLAHVLVQLDLNSLIPEHLYQAVAEVLAFIYRMNAGTSD